MHELHFYIDGSWMEPLGGTRLPVIDPSTEQQIGEIALGTEADVDRAVAAARRAFPAFSTTSVAERTALLERIADGIQARRDELADVISREMGAPITFAREAQAASGVNHFRQMRATLEAYEFDAMQGTTLVAREAIGIAGMITPWNWPINQIACKVAPALAAGCTIVLKPSELAPLSPLIFTDILAEAGVPAGVFNLVNGDGPTVGQAIARHPDIDMVSFTGSTRGGTAVAAAAAATVKRVTQELGGKAPNILLPDVDFAKAVPPGVARCFGNAGQSCSAATRMLVPADRQAEVVASAKTAAATWRVGAPADPTTTMGPLVSKVQFEKVQRLIETGIAEGATLVCGGPGRPEGLERGCYVRPTIFADVKNGMAIAQEEIFGPVLVIIPYRTIDEAVAIANDTPYGLSAYVQGADKSRALAVARRIRAGNVHVNYPPLDRSAPFGGYKRSGNGREWGRFGLEEYLEIKAVIGAA
jgi:aldehyde dehydrogenase (NAD+)